MIDFLFVLTVFVGSVAQGFDGADRRFDESLIGEWLVKSSGNFRGLSCRRVRQSTAIPTKANSVAIYEMVRNPELYPLDRCLDRADLMLARDPMHLSVFVKGLTDRDEGIG